MFSDVFDQGSLPARSEGVVISGGTGMPSIWSAVGAIADLARDDMPETVEDAFRYGKLVLAAPTYNGGVFPFMRTFIDHLTERSYQNRKVAFIENGTWAPMAAKTMKGMFVGSKGIEFVEPVVTVRSALNDASRAQIAALADALV